MLQLILWLAVSACLVYVYWYYIGPGSHGRRPPYLPPFTGYSVPEDGGSGQPIECREPGSGRKLGVLHAFTPEEVERAIAKSAKAQKEWEKTSFEERNAVLQALMDYVVEHQDELAALTAADSGKTMIEALNGEVLTTCEKLRWMIAEAKNYLQPEYRSPPLLLKAVKTARVEYVPFGVIAAIVPFNYPLHNVLSAVASIIYTGNGAVVKVSEWACWSSVKLQKILADILASRGHNPDLIQIVRGFAQTGEALVGSPNIGKVLFIGSPEVGSRVMSTASKNLTPVILELGGKDPFVVCEDADLDHVLDNALRGIFFNAGQNCLAAERFYVHAGIYDAFVSKILEKVKKIRQGDGTWSNGEVDMGCMTISIGIKKLDSLVQDAVSKGAKLLHGGKLRKTDRAEQLFWEPTILADANHSMSVVTDEAFGPIMTILKFASDDELITLANGTRYGLGLSVYSRDYARAEKLVKEIKSGMAVINDFGLGYLIQALPFGGVKASGFGKFNGPEGLREFCVCRTIVSDRIPGAYSRTPPFLQMPVSEKSYHIMRCVIALIYGVGIPTKLSAIGSLISGKGQASANKKQD